MWEQTHARTEPSATAELPELPGSAKPPVAPSLAAGARWRGRSGGHGRAGAARARGAAGIPGPARAARRARGGCGRGRSVLRRAVPPRPCRCSVRTRLPVRLYEQRTCVIILLNTSPCK